MTLAWSEAVTLSAQRVIGSTMAVEVRGTLEDDKDAAYSLVVMYSLICLGGCVAIDIVALMMALYLFVSPLELLARDMKFKMKITNEQLQSLSLTRWNIARVAVCNSIALVALGLLINFTHSTLSAALSNQPIAESEAQAMDITWSIKVDQQGLGFIGDSSNTAIVGLMDNPNDPVLRSQAYTTLHAEITRRQIEFATLVIRNTSSLVPSAYIVQTGQSLNGRIGQSFDPAGLVSQVLATGLQIRATDFLSNAEYLAENPAVWFENLHPANGPPPISPNSMLHPSIVGGTSIIRYAVTPVWKASKNRQGVVDGVLIAGDLVNGKGAILQRALDTFGSGYAGIYSYDPIKDEFVLANGMQLLNGNYIVDQPLSDTSILRQYLQQFYPNGIGSRSAFEDTIRPAPVLSGTISVNGVNYNGAIKAVPYDRQNNAFGYLLLPSQVLVLDVRGLEDQNVASQFLVIQIIVFVVNLISTSVLGYLAYRPLGVFLQKLQSYGMGGMLKKRPSEKMQPISPHEDELKSKDGRGEALSRGEVWDATIESGGKGMEEEREETLLSAVQEVISAGTSGGLINDGTTTSNTEPDGLATGATDRVVDPDFRFPPISPMSPSGSIIGVTAALMSAPRSSEDSICDNTMMSDSMSSPSAARASFIHPSLNRQGSLHQPLHLSHSNQSPSENSKPDEAGDAAETSSGKESSAEMEMGQFVPHLSGSNFVPKSIYATSPPRPFTTDITGTASTNNTYRASSQIRRNYI